MEVGVSRNRGPVVLLLTSILLIVLSCSEKEMPTQPAASSPPAGSSASAGAVTSGRGRGTVKVDPREGKDDNKTPTPTVTGTPPTATPTRTPRPGEVEVEGKVAALNAPNFTLMTRSGPVTIQTGPSTLFRKNGNPANFADLKLGEEVEVEGARLNDGSILAARVQIEDENEQEEEKTRTPTATPTPGTATGTPTPSTPTPTRTPKPDDEDNEKEVEGIVGAINATSFIVMTRSGQVTVQTNAATQFRGDGDPKSFADLKTGIEVEVKGQVQPDKSILAARVDIKND
jgi:hypothetical protein